MLNTREDFNSAFGVLQRLTDAGADPNKPDSFGNPALKRAALDAKQVASGTPSPDLVADLGQVFAAPLVAGADAGWVDPRLERAVVEERGAALNGDSHAGGVRGAEGSCPEVLTT